MDFAPGLVLLTLLALVLIMGVISIFLGLRGQRSGDHPICANCGYDLFGQDVSIRRCSECGADLEEKDSILIGHHRVRRGFVFFGIACTLIALLAIALPIIVWMKGINLITFEPVWMLNWQATGPYGAQNPAALKELDSRLAAGKLSQTQVDVIVDAILNVQANPSRPWSMAWGDFIETVQSLGKLSPQRLDRYARQAFTHSIRWRTVITRGDPLPLSFDIGTCRVGSHRLIFAYFAKCVFSSAATQQSNDGGTFSLDFPSRGSMGYELPYGPLLQELPDGPSKLHFTESTHFLLGGNRKNVIGSNNYDFDISITMLPASRPSVATRDDPSLRSAVESSLSVSFSDYSPRSGNLVLDILVSGPPAGLSYRASAIVNGKELPMGLFACPAGTTNHQYQLNGSIPNFNSGKIDLVLRPDAQWAIHTVDTNEMWDGQIILKDIPVPKR